MSNFDFLTLEVETADLFQTANFAEQNYTAKDYEGTLTKVRKLAENTAQEIVSKEGFVLDSRDNFNDYLREIKNYRIEPFIIEAFYEIKRLGNDSAHSLNSSSATQENAKRALNQIFVILVWYMNKYFDVDIKTAYLDFLEPQAEKLYQTAERKLIYIQTVDNSSGKFEGFSGTQKIGEATAPDDDFEVDWSPNSEFLRTVGAKRINQYMKTAGLKYILEWVELAWRKSTKTWFHDHDVHEVLRRSGVKHPELLDGAEWFQTDLETAKTAIKAVKEGQSALNIVAEQVPTYEITLRPEQKSAVEQTKTNFKKNKKMLWNAKMRFGKTLTSLQLIKEEKYSKVLIMTHRPVVSDSWFEDFGKMKMADEDYRFGSENKGERLENLKSGDTPFIYFVSIQKLRYDGGQANLSEFSDIDWDLIIIDEAHEGTQTELADNVLKSLEKPQTKILSLSGTPFNIQDQYDENSVYTWDYTMEQTAKLRYSLEHPTERNPYETLPKVSMYTFEMKHKERFADESKAFNFREFFRVDENGELVHKADVNAFLDNITNRDSNTNYPFSTEQYRNELRHTLWLMPGVKEANALEKLLNEHRIFGEEYKIINVVKDDKSDNNEVATAGDLDKVRQAIGDPSETKTITLTVRKLTTGVNIPEWTAVLFLSNTNSAMNYLQAAFRAQTPFSHEKLGMKKNCYIFDFAPDRALAVMAESTQINSGVGKKNTVQQKEAMTRLLNFMPILGQTDNGMKSFDVDKMLTQLKKVYAEKAVRSGFEDDSLYNDELLTLDEGDLQDFKNLREIVGKTNRSGLAKKVEINVNGLTDEEYEQGEKAQKKKKRELTPEDKKIIEKVKQAKKQRKTMISILRGISIRIPMMIYGMTLDIDRDVDIDEFVNQVDKVSWEEFMPKGINKSDFKRFAKYYDPEVFIEAGRIIRQRAKSYDDLEYTERAEKIAELFSTFKNPDKETVLTPWRVVNLQLSKTIGGLRYFDEDFENTTLNGQESITWENTEITNEVFNPDTKILDINSKTGLYPLYVTSSLFYQKRNALNEERAGQICKLDEDKIIQEILKNNIYVIAKTPMAKTITQRTMAGYQSWQTNILYVEEINAKMKSNLTETVQEIQKGLNVMKFDVVMGNPPYQEETNQGEIKAGQQKRVRNVFQDFQLVADEVSEKYSCLIYPGGRWIHQSGKGVGEFGLKQINSQYLSKLYFYPNANEIFTDVGIGDGISIVLKDYRKSDIEFEYIYNENGNEISTVLKSPGKKLIPLNPTNGEIVEKLENFIEENNLIALSESNVINQKLFQIESDFAERNPDKVELYTNQEFNFENKIKLLTNDKAGKAGRATWFIADRDSIKTNQNLIDKWKIVVSSANAGGQKRDNQLEIIDNHSAFGRSRLALKALNTEREAKNFYKYVQSYVIRFAFLMTDESLTSLAKVVPDLLDYTDKNSDIDFTRDIDNQLIELMGISKEQFDYIKRQVENFRNK